MKKYSPIILLLLAVLTTGALYLNDQSYQQLQTLKADLLSERQEYERLDQEVKQLKKLVHDLNHNPAVIEKYARDKYALARPEDQVVFFENHSK